MCLKAYSIKFMYLGGIFNKMYGPRGIFHKMYVPRGIIHKMYIPKGIFLSYSRFCF